ncbi:winged helix DNA-binding domain-containing protein [Amycolatopsis rhabdoformis]|uniref:Winged helix DNA-binding domain-containing protein n=1 Tax=Amycolatopsis rhabdoformis TaxID=1448059 RepID=A0ABZ1I6X5_9PSEU|nr:winged helix DNA-binding domain-containing protein [Amycolatopsis rhabdoformis]WSE30065.1 winged helix DNA-binding domain-containing protein [Amycolatopsis rhabdoformis]
MKLSLRALNRATLDRQLLLRRATMPALAAVEHLAGLQAQAPFPPYYALWARLHGFNPHDLAQLLLDRSVVRLVLMRGTVHLVTAADALAWRPLVQPVMDRDLRTNQLHAARVAGLDHTAVATATRELLASRPHTSTQLGTALAERWPDRESDALTHLARCLLPLVQIPPRGVWGEAGQPTYQVADHWLPGVDAVASAEQLVRRYLAAFGPATVADVQAWSGLTKLGEVVAGMDLREYSDHAGRALYDLPDATVPDENTPAPPRLLAPFDQPLLSYADRTRVISDEHRKRVISQNGLVKGTLLVGGFVKGAWEIKTTRDTANVVLTPYERLPKRDAAALESAARRLLAWAEPGRQHEVRLLPA